MQAKDRIIFPIDVGSEAKAIEIAKTLKDEVGVFKIGLELTTSAGFGVIQALNKIGIEKIFLDLKLHDIPNTVAGAMKAVVQYGVWCVTVHTSGGSAMLEAAVRSAQQAAEETGKRKPKVFGVTLLTSISGKALFEELNVCKPVQEYVVSLAVTARRAGCDGVIASPHEIEAIRKAIPDPNFLIVAPGVRPAGSDVGDQSRVMTPGEAIRKGANYLVVGRPISESQDPVLAARNIALEIESAIK